jgi:hypothetical protein
MKHTAPPLPCPFCGSPAAFHFVYAYGVPGEKHCRLPAIDGSERCGRVACLNPDCDARGMTDIEVNAVAAWNRRPGDPAPKFKTSINLTARRKRAQEKAEEQAAA